MIFLIILIIIIITINYYRYLAIKFQEMEEKMKKQKKGKGNNGDGEEEEEDEELEKDNNDDDDDEVGGGTEGEMENIENVEQMVVEDEDENVETESIAKYAVSTDITPIQQQYSIPNLLPTIQPTRTTVESEKIEVIEIKSDGSSGHLIPGRD